MKADAIGGYFELELKHGVSYHPDAICLNSARNCFEHILRVRKWKRVFLPYYSCEALLQPVKHQNIQVVFYHIDWKLEPVSLPILRDDDAFLYINYFGLKEDTVKKLAYKYREHLIVDNSQAFYSPRITGIDTFYSPRKYFGVPDGGYLYSDIVADYPIITDTSSVERMMHLCKRIEKDAESGYQLFRNAERELDKAPIMRMSNLTHRILSSIDYKECASIRRDNFIYLASHLSSHNLLNISLGPKDVPMVYPLLLNASIRQQLYDKRIYVATYWDSVKGLPDSMVESILSRNMVPLPIDQRYSRKEMDFIIRTLNSLITH